MTETFHRLRPTRPEAIDVGVATVLLLLGIIGFRTTFAGGEELLTGVPAVLLGGALGYVLAKLRVELLPATAVAVLVFALAASPIALRSDAFLGLLPTPDSLQGTVDGLVSGWIRLLTSLPPAGEAGSLLMVPYTVGFVGALVTLIAAVRLPQRPVAVLGPVAVMVVSVLFGTRRPASLVLQGVVFGAVVIAWLALREARRRTVVVGVPASRRLLSGGALVVLVAGGAAFVGPLLPGADANPRFVLREEVDPPFDPLAEPSPLAGYRRYTGVESREEPILDIVGLPAGVPVRLAVLDAYDGLVWRATGEGSALSGRFVRIGEEVLDPVEGTRASVEVTIHEPHGVWLPTVGDVVSIDFDGDEDRRDAMRFNQETETAAVPTGVEAGESYTIDLVVPESPPADVQLAGLPLAREYREVTEDIPNEIVEISARLAGGAESPYAVVSTIAEKLRTDGTFSDGGADAAVTSPPGHSLSRLARFLGAPQWVGNGEQYAAATALLARAQGVPARVVMGYQPERRAERVTITGADVAAWVEVPLDGVGWIPVNATPPEDQVPDPSVRPRPRPLNPEPQPPPPPVEPRPAQLAQDLDAAETDDEEAAEEDEEAAGGLGRLVLLGAGGGGALVTPLLLIVGLKARRRRRRRARGSAEERAAGGWDEVLDHAIDLGWRTPPQATRQEAATLLGAPSAVSLADRSNTATFAAREPTEEELVALWDEVDRALGELREEHSAMRRLRAAVSLRSLRRGRRGG